MRTTSRTMASHSGGASGVSWSDCGGACSSRSCGSRRGGCTTDSGRCSRFGSRTCSSGIGRSRGTGSRATQPYSSVSTSIHAVTSAPVTATGPAVASPASGANPITTRAGNPSPPAISAAAAEYCSASPIMTGSVKSSARRSEPWPDRLGGSSSETPCEMYPSSRSADRAACRRAPGPSTPDVGRERVGQLVRDGDGRRNPRRARRQIGQPVGVRPRGQHRVDAVRVSGVESAVDDRRPADVVVEESRTPSLGVVAAELDRLETTDGRQPDPPVRADLDRELDLPALDTRLVDRRGDPIERPRLARHRRAAGRVRDAVVGVERGETEQLPGAQAADRQQRLVDGRLLFVDPQPGQGLTRLRGSKGGSTTDRATVRGDDGGAATTTAEATTPATSRVTTEPATARTATVR